MVWLLATILTFQTPTSVEKIAADKLGRERSQFGDIPNSGLWKHSYVGQFGGTDILFPAGSSNERYYVTSSPGAKRWRISKQTKLNGKIRKDWMIFVETGTETRIKSPGPLWLHGGGGKIVGQIPKTALTDLQNKTPLALYHANVHASYCIFISSDGKKSDMTWWDAGIVTKLPGGGIEEDFSNLPKTPGPYPITPEELEYVYRKR